MMHENTYANDFKDLENLICLDKKEQTLISLRSFNDHNDASWAYKGSNQVKINSLSKERLKLPTGTSSLVLCRHLQFAPHEVA